MKKIAQAIVRLRKMILILAVLLLIPSAVGAIATRINYDILSYLPPELDSRVGQLILEDDYQLASTSMITVEGLPTHELLAMKQDIDAIPGVLQTFWLSDVVDPAIPVEMLPADVQKFLFGKNDSTILIVRLGGSSVSEETMEAVAQIKKVLRRDCFFGGISVIFYDTKALVTQEMPLYLLFGGGACLLDTGFGFCGEALAVHVRRALAERPLDAIHRFKPYPRRSPRGASGIFLCASRPFMKDL